MFEHNVQHINVVDGLSRRDKGRDHVPALRRQREFHRIDTLTRAPLRMLSAAISSAMEGITLRQRIDNGVKRMAHGVDTRQTR